MTMLTEVISEFVVEIVSKQDLGTDIQLSDKSPYIHNLFTVR